MATRHSKAKARRSRNSHALASKLTLQDRIDWERRRLQQADAVLSCIAIAFDHREWKPRQIDYADAIDVANELVLEAINRLDSINLLRARPADEE